MRLCAWAGARRLLPVLVLLTVEYVQAEQLLPKERHYYIAAVEIDWNYSGNDWHRFGSTYKKVVFREYDKGFRQAKTHPSWLGLLGPTLRAEEGETIVVTFRNMATGPHSIHPHGIAYGKQSEGAQYFDNTSLKEKEDDVVQPNSEHVYYWEVTPDVSPQKNDPTCLTYTYISHANFVEDLNSGLIGTLLICKPGSLNESGKQIAVHQEYVFLFGVFDENKSKYKPNSYAPDDHVKYTINGFAEGSLPDVNVCAHAPVSLHMVGMSSDPEVFSVHINGQVLQQTGHKVSSVGLISGSTTTVSMVALHTGRWLMSSHTLKHIQAEMHGFIDVGKCDGFDAPRRRLTIQQKRESTEWTYYIAAEEIVWDYAPGKQEHIDEDFKAQYLKQSPTRIGSKYKKAVYVLYKNESFTEKLETKQRKNELGILGPVIRAQIRDVIKIVFKNKASRPYSIYPHGLTIEKSEEGVNYPVGSNQSHGVLPGETHTYIWRVVDEDEPLDSDSRCLTRMYHSAVNTPRDIASGLIGPILICKSASLNVRNVQLRADKEQHAVFSVFDENKSWYVDDNIRQYCDRSRVNKADPDFHKSNVMHTINGYVFETGPLLGFCNGEVATWHVSSVGAQDYIQTATFYGHRFKLNDQIEDFLSLYPMTGETITMDMDNIGVWLLASLNSHETTKGIRVKFQDVECFRDYQYEYTDYNDKTLNNEFTLWKPPSMDDVKKEEEKPKDEHKNQGKADFYTEMFANELGLRSLKNQSGSTDVEKLDLSFLDYDAIDVNDGDTNISSALTEKNNKNNTFILKPNAQNKTLVPTRKEVNILNHTAIHLRNQSSSENAMNVGDTKSPTVSPKSDSVFTNSSASNAAVSDAKNTTVYNATTLLLARNSLTKTTDLTLPLEGNSSATLETITMYGTLTGNKQASVDMITTEDSEERLIRGDAFSYFEPSSNETTVTLQSTSENKTEVHVIVSADEVNQTLSAPVDTEGGNVSSKNRHNLTAFQSEMVSQHNKNNDSWITTAEVDYSLNTTSNSSLENVTNIWLEPGNAMVNITASNSPVEISLDGLENVTALLVKLNETSSNETFSSETTDPVASTVSVPSYAIMSSSEELITSDSEEVFIYLKENKTDLIKTTSVKVQGHNWTYDGTHQTVPMEIPEDMLKYLGKETPRATPAPKKRKKVNLRHRPLKGQGMKTKRRKEYKPQTRSGLPFSPRGFNPGMTPRGSRPLTPQPVSDEEDLGNNPVVIGVPRLDFSDYELYIPGDEPDHLGLDGQNVKADEYEYVSYKDPYSSHEDVKNYHMDENTKYFLKNSGPNVRTYFIAAEEVPWDYGGYGQRRQEMLHNSRETKFTKVVFRRYMDISFTTPEVRGELDEHLGILGPVIKAEVGQSIMVMFKNNAKRPYSIHPNGVSYTKQTEGLSYEDGSKYWYKYDNEVQPGTTFTYIWKVPAAVGPKPDESHCRTWVYYSGVNPEKDIHSGLIGPLLVCREGTLAKELIDTREFTLLFMTFDETQSWYFEKNQETIQRKSRRRLMDPDKEKFMFHSINGIIYNLKGLRMYTNQLVSWHLINMGSPRDYQSVHFHGQTFLYKKTTSYRQAVFPLLPGSFATLEMYPSKPGLWLLETEVGINQQMGMQTLFLVLDNDCGRPLGLESGSVKDEQITAINTRGYWGPHLARLNNPGKYNAWSTEDNSSWIQVDFQRPVVISQVATQGARQMFYSQFVMNYYISYSTDRRKWVFYKGDSTELRKEFTGNQEAYETKKNTLFPPVIGRFIRLHPTQWYNKATVRMEFYGCELDGCSVPLGMESGEIEDHRITASSTASSWYSGPWRPELARLNKQGTINAWRAEIGDMNQWLQVELPQIKKITGIITQGAKSLGTEMYVISYSLQHSNNGMDWLQYSDDESIECKIFLGNTNNSDHVKNYIYPPIFARFIRIVPKTWMNSITLRIELLGCEFE